MKALAKGTHEKYIFKLLRVLIDTHQEDLGRAIIGDTAVIEDIADKLETPTPKYANMAGGLNAFDEPIEPNAD